MWCGRVAKEGQTKERGSGIEQKELVWMERLGEGRGHPQPGNLLQDPLESEVLPLVASSTENLKDSWWEETGLFKAGPEDDTVDYLTSLSVGSRDQAWMEKNKKV